MRGASRACTCPGRRCARGGHDHGAERGQRGGGGRLPEPAARLTASMRSICWTLWCHRGARDRWVI
jgi:hypothetical protein